MSNKLLEKSGEVAPEEIKRLSYRRSKEAELQKEQRGRVKVEATPSCFVVEVKSDAVKGNTAQETGMLGP